MPSRRLSGAPGGLQDGGEAGNRGAFCRGGWLSIEPQGSVSAIGRSSCLTSMLSGSLPRVVGEVLEVVVRVSLHRPSPFWISTGCSVRPAYP